MSIEPTLSEREEATGGNPEQPLDPRPRNAPAGLIGALLVDAMRDRWVGLRRVFDRPRKRLAWGQKKDRVREHWLAEAYHVMRRAELADFVDDRTWSDLHGEQLFAEIDRCACPLGEQILYHVMRTPTADDAELQRRDRVANRLEEEPRLREPLERQFRNLDTYDAYFLHNLLRSNLPGRPRFYFVFPILALASVACFTLLIYHPTMGAASLLAILGINLFVQHRYQDSINPIARPLRLVHRLLRVAESIGALRDSVLDEEFQALRAAAFRLRPLKKATRHLRLEGNSNELTAGVYAWINAFLLIDINAFVASIRSVIRQRADLAFVFERLGFLDAMLSLASWRSGRQQWCRPERLPAERRLEFRDLVHPLIHDAVGNDLRVDGTSILITGSNMSGKTTFIRAVAANAILARTLHTCTAAQFRAPHLVVHSMIAREDDLARGQSYFAVELKLVQELLHAADRREQLLFVIDEIFRGTNTTERVAAAKAILDYLHAGHNMVLAATHDLELLPLLNDAWDFRHFRESIENGAMRFDYRIRAGAASSHNALALMAASGFPPSVVESARETALRLAGRLADPKQDAPAH